VAYRNGRETVHGRSGGAEFMKILAIDPGTFDSAYVVWDSENRKIDIREIANNHDVLHFIKFGKYDVMAIEMIASYGMPVGKETFETCVWIGRFRQVGCCPVQFIYRKEVKMFLCGNMRAKDGNIRQALLDMLGKDTCRGVSKDMWSALAVAVTCENLHKTEEVCGIAEEIGL
jgi:Holliday junction resolvasome RuvABC endonuclease subunit